MKLYHRQDKCTQPLNTWK